MTNGRRPMRPVLVLNPADDDAFTASAAAAAEHHPDSPEALQDEIRRASPRATVHVRELVGEPDVVWYVYREGHWVGMSARPAHGGPKSKGTGATGAGATGAGTDAPRGSATTT